MNILRLGERIRELRIQKGLSQKELADGVCSESYVSQIERGIFTGEISVEKLSGFSMKLGVTLQELLGAMDTADLQNDILIDIVNAAIHRGEFVYALEVINQLQESDSLLLYQQEQVTLSWADCLTRKGEAPKAIEILIHFINDLETRNSTNSYLLATATNLLGSAHFLLNEIVAAYSHYIRAYQISLRFPTEDLLTANINYNLGNICRLLRNDVHARLYLETAMRIYESIGNKTRLADTMYYLAITMKNFDQLQKAAEYIKNSLALYEAENISRMVRLTKTQFAFYILAPQDIEQAISELNESLSEYEELGDQNLWIHTIARIAHLHLESDQIDKAKELIEIALPCLDRDEVNTNYAYFYRVYSRFLTDIKEYEKSLEYSFKSADLCAKMGLVKEQASSLRQSVEALHLQGKLDEALEMSRKVTDLYEKALDYLVLS